MMAALIILAALFAVGFPLWLHHRLRSSSVENEPTTGGEATGTETTGATTTGAESTGAVPGQEEPEECCGQHAVCERDSLLAGVSPEAVYYDDEELDAFRGRSPESYSQEETEMFRDVMLTLLPDDVAGWGRSLQLRGIEMPEPVRDEFLMLAAEIRSSRGSATPSGNA